MTTPPDDLILRVAVAIADSLDDWESLTLVDQARFKRAAKKAIEATANG